jgi:hypothetical protein
MEILFFHDFTFFRSFLCFVDLHFSRVVEGSAKVESFVDAATGSFISARLHQRRLPRKGVKRTSLKSL